MKILGIETSCDETSAAVVTDDKKILANCVLSQMEHQEFGGVVPEIAARAHLKYIENIIRQAMDDSQTSFEEIDGIAATCGPGLIGGVMVGMMTAKALAAVHNKPFLAINHLEGHALTPRLTDDIAFPYLLLLVSGGHSQILIVQDVGKYKRLGTTIDDALGEAFDKTAKLMGLGYPGGPALEKLALNCPDLEHALKQFPLPTPMKGKDNCLFSFSGLKTAVRRYIDAFPEGPIPRDQAANLCAAFQHSVALVVEDRLKRAINLYTTQYPNLPRPTLVVSGGVAANKYLRQKLEHICHQTHLYFSAPPIGLCSDNGAMIAWAGVERFKKGLTDPLDYKARPRWPLDPDAPPAIGAGVKA